MTYFGFLVRFVLIPILVLLVLAWRDSRRGIVLPPALRLLPPAGILATLVVVALLYTTPWDNYLVATGVWWYRPELVVGITLGWVPLEEYTFFVLQTVMTGLLLLFLARHLRVTQPFRARPGLRKGAVAVGGVLWLGSLLLLLTGWRPGTYLSLILVWALPPLLLQMAVGADILWHHRRVVLTALFSASIYLAATDSLAIAGGTWSIDPEQSLHLLLGGILPLEEAIFFFVTNMLVVFGLTLGLSTESARRLPARVLRAPA